MNLSRNNSLYLAAVAWLSALGALLAADGSDGVPAPTVPFVAFPQDRAAYAITVTGKQPDVSSPASPALKAKTISRIDVTLAAPLQHWLTRWTDGSQTELWISGGLVIAESPYGNWLTVTGAAPSSVLVDPVRAEDFNWIGLKNYRSTVVRAGVPCYLYQGDFVGGTPGKAPALARSAWIAISNHLPVAVQYGDTIYTYTFSNSAPGRLALPQRFQDQLQRVKRRPALAQSFTQP